MKNLLLLVLLTSFSASAFADDSKGGSWFGGLVGKAKAEGGGSITPTVYGVSFGTKKGSLGYEALLLTGTAKASAGVVSGEQSAFIAGGRLDLFAGKFFYIGPMLSYATVKTTVSVLGISVAVNSSGFVYGGGGGINIPLGKISLGGEAGYQIGKIEGTSVKITHYVGSLKLWF